MDDARNALNLSSGCRIPSRVRLDWTYLFFSQVGRRVDTKIDRDRGEDNDSADENEGKEDEEDLEGTAPTSHGGGGG